MSASAGPSPTALSGASSPAPSGETPRHRTVETGDGSHLAAMALLRLETDVRAVASLAELDHLMANETVRYARARQVFVMRITGRERALIVALTGQPSVDRTTPLCQMIEAVVGQVLRDGAAAVHRTLDLAQFPEAAARANGRYPFQQLLWLPLVDRDGHGDYGLLLARDQPWNDADIVLTRHLAGAFGYARRALGGHGARRHRPPARRIRGAAGLVLLTALAMVPVPLSVLAPMEIGPKEPFVVSAPVDGIVAEVLVDPNVVVSRGDVLLRLADTTQRNKLEIAERELQVADARLRKFSQMAFDDLRGRHELAIAHAELAARAAERDLARDLLQRTVVTAPRDGIALFTDKRDIVGRPVGVGERLMEIADPAHVELRAHMSVGDSIVLQPGSRIRAFLDADPSHSVGAAVTRFDYMARPTPTGTMAYLVLADIEPGSPVPRLGARGTAQIAGGTVTLAFYLFRRPLAALRQWIGL